jgi:hypothetical protein
VTTTISVHSMRDGSRARDLAILDLLQLQELGLAPGAIRTERLKRLWSVSQSQVSRRMAAIHQLGRYWVEARWGEYRLHTSRPITAKERWETLQQQFR